MIKNNKPEETEYQKALWCRIRELPYPHAIAIFGGACLACKETCNLDKFITVYLNQVAINAAFFKFELGVTKALNMFCHLCLVDPMLIEAYLGIKFEEVAKHYEG